MAASPKINVAPANIESGLTSVNSPKKQSEKDGNRLNAKFILNLAALLLFINMLFFLVFYGNSLSNDQIIITEQMSKSAHEIEDIDPIKEKPSIVKYITTKENRSNTKANNFDNKSDFQAKKIKALEQIIDNSKQNQHID